MGELTRKTFGWSPETDTKVSDTARTIGVIVIVYWLLMLL